MSKKNCIEKSKWINIIKEKIEESGALTRQVEEELEKQVYMSEQQVVPVNIAPTISKVIETVKETAHNKDVNFLYHKSELNTLSYVEPQSFEKLISVTLHLLINDAAHQSIISIIILDESEKNDNTIKINFSNMGNGVPKEQLEKALSCSHAYADDHDDYLSQITSLANKLDYWGGKLTIQTEIGSGFSIDITLRTFSFSFIKNAPSGQIKS
jgi:hypothetical protein